MDDTSLAAALAHAARTIGKPRTMEETLQTIVDTAQMSVPGFEHVGISTIDRKGKITTRAATGPLVWELDDLQYSLDEGPCVDSMRGVALVQAPWIRHNRRWLRYVPAAVEKGLQAQLAVRLYLDDEGTVGGLNLYSTSNEKIHPHAVAMADLFATHAALALGKVRDLANLNEALRSRETIGKAVGWVMARYGLDDEAAFSFLARASSHSNIRVRDLAARMLEEHAADIKAERTTD